MSAGLPLSGERYHLFGVAGRGLAPLAVGARHLGAEVSGCDRGGAADIRAFVDAAGVACEPGHDVRHVREGWTVVATSVAPADDPEIRAADEAGRLWHRTDLLATVLRCRRSAGITGSHGKGTVTVLAAAAMETAGLDPLALVGAQVPRFGGPVRLGDGPIVAEVDDSDLSLGRIDTDVAVVTNLDDDHPHLETTLGQSVAAVGEFVSRARDRVVLGPSPRADRLASYAHAELWRYGREFGARVRAAGSGETHLELTAPDGVRVPALVRLLGARIEVNAALAFAVALSLGAEPEAAAAGLGDISAIGRRLEPVGVRDGIHVYDDFGGKHPANVRAGLAALRRHFPEARITAVFEPYGPYLARWGRRYARALAGADRIVLVPPRVPGRLLGRAALRRGMGRRVCAPADPRDRPGPGGGPRHQPVRAR